MFRHAAAYAVLCIGLGLTVSAHEYVANNLRSSTTRIFQEEVEDVLGRLRRRLDAYLTTLLATRALFIDEAPPTPAEFEAFVRNLEIAERAAGIHGIGYALFRGETPPLLEPSAPFALTERPRQAGYVGFGPSSRPIGVDRWIGGPMFRRAIETARDSGHAVATPRITIDTCDEKSAHPGFVVYVPIYQPATVTAIDERRTAMRGVVFATFCAPELFRGLLYTRTLRMLDVELYDGDPEDGALLYDTAALEHHAGSRQREHSTALDRSVELEIGDRTWTMHFAGFATVDDPSQRALAPVVAFGGVMLSILLFAIVLSQTGARSTAESGEKRSQLLADAGRVFTANLDERLAIRELARLPVPAFADWCLIALYDGDGVQHDSFGANDVPAPAEAAMIAACAARPASSLLLTGHTELVTDARLAGSSSSIPQEVLTACGARAFVRAPMIARGELLGMVTFVVTGPLRRYGPEDVLLATELARVSCSAIDGARLHRRTEEASRLKDEFLATLSHELRTPLNAILGWAHLLRSAILDDSTKTRAIETIERNARQQAQIVSDLLDVSRIILGQVELDRAPIDLPSVIAEAVEAQRLAAESKRIQIHTEIDPAATMVIGDRARLNQILWNLLSNAIKFTPNEGAVEVQVIRGDDFVELSISDTGQGISAEFLPFIFERFRQADGSSTRTHGGLGLGLAIVRHLVELHGGTVRASSEGIGKGSTFVVRLHAATRTTGSHEMGPRPERRSSSITTGKQIA